jgi:alkanesulfonate monooxygenase SsuD/methylene tetrahydromethanopterin reductase-like flavin-dependent oxidoreductase (luciferase family)
VIGNALPLYDPPTRVAEEMAILDVLSGGRLIAGMVVGGGPEYYSFSINPTEARSRFREALDLVIRAWTEDGPFEHHGEHFRLRYVNPWPKPIQKPHPPIWIPGIGSIETMELVAERRYAYMGIPYFHISAFEKNFSMFRKVAEEQQGYTPEPEQTGWLTPIYVGETDAKAREEFEPHLWYFAKRLLQGIAIVPPGYTSARSFSNILKQRSSFLTEVTDWDQVEEGAYAIVGSAETVRQKLAANIERLGVGNLLALLQLGSLPADLTRANMDRFAADVLPFLRAEFGPA